MRLCIVRVENWQQIYNTVYSDVVHVSDFITVFHQIINLMIEFTLSAEIGDYDSEIHTETYIADMKLLPRQVCTINCTLHIAHYFLRNISHILLYFRDACDCDCFLGKSNQEMGCKGHDQYQFLAHSTPDLLSEMVLYDHSCG